MNSWPTDLIPSALRASVAGRQPDSGVAHPIDGDRWLVRLPVQVDEYLDRWNLTPDGTPLAGENALVLPVRRDTGELAALKLSWPHHEAQFEHLALRLWAGGGAVTLLAADPTPQVLLLERLDPTRPLTGVSIFEACEVIGGLFGALGRLATPQAPALADHLSPWESPSVTPQVPQRLVQQAAASEPDLLSSAPQTSLVHTDLHDANVLAPLDPERGEWLAIDPKVVAGEWAYAVAPIVWNRPDDLARAHDLRVHARLRADIVGDVAGLDPDRVRAWTFVRLVRNAVDTACHAPGNSEFLTRMITLAKAFAD
ncbi:aminoglycoside phosphotransferase family protein [Aestuariimicrobium ganziense]|uniref:aminoglycoside phosphotransferase family protein n=1 Tax=Aestuariimicrobium ganziense TaxID=2773677 RepID=UPI0019408DFD|nr:aminoglycoside phosphotransferase family protein [Aestuariimicrobium ganziense]